ncbi:MAG: outer membrane protein transport protein [Wenzhouxiangellaceae bacterium]|nr:outer membrane protein transport protein [Wenzhouxiangellaceae bacterium]
MRRSIHGLTAFALVSAAAAGPAAGSSFQLLEQSPARLGTAFSGTASMADDSASAFFNPAAMARFEDARLTLSGHVVAPEADFRDDGSASLLAEPPMPVPGPAAKTDAVSIVPNLYWAHPLGERWTAGLAITAPFGLLSEYPSNWRGRYHATDSQLAVIGVNPSVAFAVTDRLSLGFGASWQYAEATLENRIDSFAACAGAGGTIEQCTLAHGGPANASADGAVRIEGDDDAVVVNAGLHWQVSDATALGLSWRQGASFDLAGAAAFEPSSSCSTDPFCAGALAVLQGPVAAPLALPDTWTLSLTQDIAPGWRAHADIARTEWSVLDDVVVRNAATGVAVSELELGYEDTTRVALGADWQWRDGWLLRFGVARDEAPQTDPGLATPRIPDEDRTWLSLGLHGELGASLSVDLGYAHLFVDDDVRIESVEQGVLLRGRFEADVDVLGAQLNWRF